jgi:hypothetical protein
MLNIDLIIQLFKALMMVQNLSETIFFWTFPTILLFDIYYFDF